MHRSRFFLDTKKLKKQKQKMNVRVTDKLLGRLEVLEQVRILGQVHSSKS